VSSKRPSSSSTVPPTLQQSRKVQKGEGSAHAAAARRYV
jgi:hypothetical protein